MGLALPEPRAASDFDWWRAESRAPGQRRAGCQVFTELHRPAAELVPKLGPGAPHTCRARLPLAWVPLGLGGGLGEGRKVTAQAPTAAQQCAQHRGGGSLKEGPLKLKQSIRPLWNFKRQLYPDRNLSKTEKLGSNY